MGHSKSGGADYPVLRFLTQIRVRGAQSGTTDSNLSRSIPLRGEGVHTKGRPVKLRRQRGASDAGDVGLYSVIALNGAE